MSDDDDEFPGFIKVSKQQEVRRLAGNIAWNARRGDHKPLLASGPVAIARAVEAIAGARRFLGQDEHPLELLCQPAFRTEAKTASLAFYFSTLPARKDDVHDAPVTFSVSRASKPAVVAGALAARAREGLGPALTAIGEEAVCNAAVAVCRARLYLEDDGLDVRFLNVVEPVTKTHNSDGKEHTLDAIKFRIYVERVEPGTAGMGAAGAGAAGSPP